MQRFRIYKILIEPNSLLKLYSWMCEALFAIFFLTFFIASTAATLAYADASSKSPYDSGYDHGCDDSELDPEDRYINESGKGAAYHTDEFMDGYRDGYDKCKNELDTEGSASAGPRGSVSSDECFDEGFEDGRDNPFSQDKYVECGGSQGAGNNAYYNGFVAGCLSVEGNTANICESATDS
jgi:hypothetical protein